MRNKYKSYKESYFQKVSHQPSLPPPPSYCKRYGVLCLIQKNYQKYEKNTMNKWDTVNNLIRNRDYEGLQDILHDEYLYLRETTLVSKNEMVEFIKKKDLKRV